MKGCSTLSMFSKVYNKTACAIKAAELPPLPEL